MAARVAGYKEKGLCAILSAAQYLFSILSGGAMSTTADMVGLLKTELKTAGITYAMLAERLGMAESSVKRMFSKSGDMPL